MFELAGVPPGLFTKRFRAAPHEPATLTRTARLPPEHTAPRVELLVNRLAMI